MPTLSELFNLDPNVERLSLLPRLRGSLPSEKSVMMPDRYMPDVIAPKILYDFIRAIKAPGRAARGEVLDEEEALNTALNMFGGGLATSGSVPIGAIGMSARTKAPVGQELKLREAARVASLPVEQGGLGLPIGNTPAMRAEALGYTDYLHGTQRLDRLLEGKNLDPRRATSGPMPYGTPEPSLASGYATSKPDTSRIASDAGEMSGFFQVEPKELGFGGRNLIDVEKTWYYLPADKKAEIADKAKRIGYKNPQEGSGPFTVHADESGGIVDKDTYDWYLKRESGGNPLTALRKLWAESGTLDPYAPTELAEIYKLAGYPYKITQTNAPWTEAQGVMLGKARITNPLKTDDIANLRENVIPYLKEQFKNDRTRRKTGHGVDPWDKNVRYTPKEWVDQLEKDLQTGENSYVWTSIPDKITKTLKDGFGYNGIIDKSGKGGGAMHDVVIPFEPGQVRSKFAAFNPAKTGENDMLAVGNPYGLPAVAAQDPLEQFVGAEQPKFTEQDFDPLMRYLGYK